MRLPTPPAEIERLRALVVPILDAPFRRRQRSLFDPEQPKTPTGRPLGRPRGDAAVLGALNAAGWTLASTVAARLGLNKMAACQRLIRAQRRGLLEHCHGKGYRRRAS